MAEEIILRILLSVKGPMKWDAIEERDEAKGVNPRTLRRAREHLTKESIIERTCARVDGTNLWLWSIVPQEEVLEDEKF